MINYDAALAYVAQALIDDSADRFDGWAVYDHPTSNLDDHSIALAPMRAERVQRDVWIRDALVGVFVPWASVEESIATLDAMTVTLSAALEEMDGVIIEGEVEGPTPVTVAGTKYLAQFHPIRIEVTTS